MKILADEGVDRQIVVRLREEGHSLHYVAEMEPGVPDDVVLELANRERCLLLTPDKDFGEMVFRQRRLSEGIVLIRLAGLSQSRKADIVVRAFRAHGPRFPDAFTG